MLREEYLLWIWEASWQNDIYGFGASLLAVALKECELGLKKRIKSDKQG